MVRVAGTTMAFVVVGFTSGGVAAAELAKKGTFDARYYSHNVQTMAELDTADGMKGYVNEAYEFHQGKQKGAFFDGTSARCLGYGTYHPEKGAVHEVGRCTAVDADGDKIFEEYLVDLKDANDKTPATGHLLGGTGKYQGLKGTFTATVEMWQPQGQGHAMWGGDVKGDYSLGD